MQIHTSLINGKNQIFLDGETVIVQNPTFTLIFGEGGQARNLLDTDSPAPLQLLTGDTKQLKALNKLDSLETADKVADTPHSRKLGVKIGSTILSREDLETLCDFCHDDDTRYYANGVVMCGDKAVASDALTLCKADLQFGTSHEEVLVPRTFIKALLKVCKGLAHDSFCFEMYEAGDGYFAIQVVTHGLTATCRNIAGQFPPYGDAFPQKVNHALDIYWNKQTDLDVANSGIRRVISSLSFGVSEVEFKVNADLFKKCMKHGGNVIHIDQVTRPIQWKNKNYTILCVPCRY